MTLNLYKALHVVRTVAIATAAAVGLVVAGHCAAAQISVSVKDQNGQPVADTVVYANIISGTAPNRPKREISIEQINKEFVPLVSVIQTGTLVNFPNRDKVRHHVYSFSPIKAFELKLYAGTPSNPVVFDKPGIAVLGCNIHDSMVAWVVVVETPYYGQTAATGKLRLDNVPPGNYRLRTWHPDMPTGAAAIDQAVVLPAATAAAVVTVRLAPAG